MKNVVVGLIGLCLLLCNTQTSAKDGQIHFPELFLGYSQIEGELAFTFAAEYEYKFSEKFGAGLTWESVPDAWSGKGLDIGLASLYYHPVKAVRVGVGVGQEIVGGDKPYRADVYRLIASYDYHFENLSIAPTIAIDFADNKQVFVFGIGIIRPF